MERKVTPDHIVHYYAEGDPRTGPFDALVVNVHDDEWVDLIVAFATGDRVKQRVPHSPTPLKHHWSWPPS